MVIFKGFFGRSAKKPNSDKSGGDKSAQKPENPPPPPTDARTRAEQAAERQAATTGSDKTKPSEVGGPKGLEPTRYGDWEKAGRCIDF